MTTAGHVHQVAGLALFAGFVWTAITTVHLLRTTFDPRHSALREHGVADRR